MKIRLLLLLALILLLPTIATADDMAGPYVYKTSVRINTQHYLVYWPSPTAKEPHYLTGSWLPKLTFNVQGPLEGGSQISVNFTKPGGAKWFSRDLPTPECAADTFQNFSLESLNEKDATNLAGIFGVSIVLSNALNGTKQILYSGKFTVVKFHYGSAPNEVNQADFWVNHDWNLPIGQMGFDEDQSNAEAPQLQVKMWFRGPMETSMLAGYLYYNGKQISSTKSMGDVGIPIVIEPGTTRPDLTYSRAQFNFAGVAKGRFGESANNYDAIFMLDKHPGDYEIKVLRNGKLARSAKFSVGADGAVVDNGLGSGNKMGKGVMLIPVTTDLSQDDKAVIANYKSLAFYGNPVVGFP